MSVLSRLSPMRRPDSRGFAGAFLFALVLAGADPGGGKLGAAGFPEPDVIIFGFSGELAPASIRAEWPRGTAAATSPEPGRYVIRVPLEHAVGDPSDDASSAARIGDRVTVFVSSQPQGAPHTISQRGQLIEHDLRDPGGPGSPLAGFRRGDTNGDASTDLTDGISILAHLFAGGVAATCPDAMDVDDNGRLEITDGIFLLAHLFLGDQAPPAPFSECGADPTADALGNCGQTACGAPDAGATIAIAKAVVRAPDERAARNVRPASTRASSASSVSSRGALDARAMVLARAMRTARERDRAGATRRASAGDLALDLVAIDFGAVEIGDTVVRSLVVRNLTPTDLLLEEPTADGDAAFAPVASSLAVPAAGHAVLAVGFEPETAGPLEGSLNVIPGLVVSLRGEGQREAPIARVESVRLERDDWEPEATCTVPIRFELPPAARTPIDFALLYAAADLEVVALRLAGDAAGARLEVRSDAPGEWHATLDRVAAGARIEARAEVRALAAADAVAFVSPIALELVAAAGSSHRAGTHGELVVGAPPALDGAGEAGVVGDCDRSGLRDYDDALRLARFLYAGETTGIDPEGCDLDGDGELAPEDLARLLATLAGE